MLRLLRRNPFPDRPPRYVRARLFHYRFTSWRELRETGAWWTRTPAGEFAGPIRSAAHDRGAADGDAAAGAHEARSERA